MLCFLISILDSWLHEILLFNNVKSPILMYKTTPLFWHQFFSIKKGSYTRDFMVLVHPEKGQKEAKPRVGNCLFGGGLSSFVTPPPTKEQFVLSFPKVEFYPPSLLLTRGFGFTGHCWSSHYSSFFAPNPRIRFCVDKGGNMDAEILQEGEN